MQEQILYVRKIRDFMIVRKPANSLALKKIIDQVNNVMLSSSDKESTKAES